MTGIEKLLDNLEDDLADQVNANRRAHATIREIMKIYKQQAQSMVQQAAQAVADTKTAIKEDGDAGK